MKIEDGRHPAVHRGRASRATGGLDAAEAGRRAGELIDRLQAELNQLIAARTAAGKRVYLLTAGQASEAVAQLFPPPPAPADLHQTDTAYARTATKVLYKMKKDLDEPPGRPLPGA